MSGSSDTSESEDEVDGSLCNQSSGSNPCDFGLNGDNLDWIRRPSIYSSDKDTETIHWFNLLAYDNRVVDWGLPDKDPIKNIMDLENSTFIPSPQEHSQLKDEFVVLVLRILTKHCKYFQQFANIVPVHIPHPYRKEMSCQSQVVSMAEYNQASCIIISLGSVTFHRVPLTCIFNTEFICLIQIISQCI